MPLIFDHRVSDSPFIERVWQTQGGSSGEFTSIALNHWQMCIWCYQGQTRLTLRGPETRPTPSFCPPDADFFGVVFKVSSLMPSVPASRLVDRAIHQSAECGRIWLGGASWEVPRYDNVDVFIDRLARGGVLVRDSIIDSALHGHPTDVSLRSVQRRFLNTTGLSHTALYQIGRARQAALLLGEGVSILDTTERMGYADQSHLTRALRRWIGYTPAQLFNGAAAPLSFLFKTTDTTLAYPEPVATK